MLIDQEYWRNNPTSLYMHVESKVKITQGVLS